MARRLLFSLALLAAVASAAALHGRTAAPASVAAKRIVAIGDVHGAAETFASILTRAGLLDARRRWAGGKTVFVQTGDVTDRGAGVREALELLMALEKQAASAGGKVHVLLGNHEIMNMLGDLRDVSPEAAASLGGLDAYRAAFAKDGRYGKWLRTKWILAEVDDTVFMHAGINLDYTTASLDDVKKRARREIAEWDAGLEWLLENKRVLPSAGFVEIATAARTEIERINAAAEAGDIPPEAPKVAALLLPLANIHLSSLFDPQGPLWFRGYAMWTDEEGPARMNALLKHHRVKRFVTGHTVQPGGRITERFGGALFLIDTGMLGGKYWPSGRPSALELLPSGANPVYVD